MAKAKAPKVEGLAKSMATLDPVYSEQRALVNEQIEGLGAASDVRRERLEGVKVDAFNQINDQATGRGVGGAFSGIPLHEQTDFLSREYLPGMQDIEMMEGAERMQLRGTLADLNSQQMSAALSRVDQQTQALNQWNLQQAQIDAQARENKLNRKFQTSERVAGQKFTAAENAANRSHSASMAAASRASSPAPSADSLITSMLMGATGDDGTVPKGVWQAAIREAERSGMKFTGKGGFADTYWAFRPK